MLLWGGWLLLSYWLYAATTQVTTTTTKEILPDGTVSYKTVTYKTTTNTVSEIKDTLVATSTSNELLLFHAIKEYRKNKKTTHTLKYSSKLSDIARSYAKKSSNDWLFSHKDKDGHDGKYRLVQWWIKENTYRWELMSEAVDAAQALKALQDSPKHNAILLEDTNYTIMGVWYYKWTWVVMFLADKKWVYEDKVQPSPIKKTLRRKKMVTTNS